MAFGKPYFGPNRSMAPACPKFCAKIAVLAPRSKRTEPAGDTQGNVQVTVKLAAVIVGGDISSLNTALIEVLLGTPTVGPGVVVAGTVNITLGLVVSALAPVGATAAGHRGLLSGRHDTLRPLLLARRRRYVEGPGAGPGAADLTDFGWCGAAAS